MLLYFFGYILIEVYEFIDPNAIAAVYFYCSINHFCSVFAINSVEIEKWKHLHVNLSLLIAVINLALIAIEKLWMPDFWYVTILNRSKFQRYRDTYQNWDLHLDRFNNANSVFIFFFPTETIFYANVFAFLKISFFITSMALRFHLLLFIHLYLISLKLIHSSQADLLNYEYLLSGKERVEEYRFRNFYSRRKDLPFLLRLHLWGLSLLLAQLHLSTRPLQLCKCHFNGLPEGCYWSQDDKRSYNLIPFIACAHIFSLSEFICNVNLYLQWIYRFYSFYLHSSRMFFEIAHRISNK